MVEGIEALLALERTGTISEAAAQLRLTQSAVSKRIQTLENELEFRLIEPVGRRVRLTSRGIAFLNRARLLVSELKSLKHLQPQDDINHFSIAISDSIAASWGPRLIRLATKKLKGLEFEIHVHRSTLVEENVKLGRYHLGLCISNSNDPQLVSSKIIDEPMVLLPNRAESENPVQRLITIEKNSGSWKTLGDRITSHPKLKSFELTHVESFAAIVQMVHEGFGSGLVPLGIAQTMRVSKKDILVLSPKIARPIKLISRKNIAQLPAIEEFKNLITQLATEL